MKLAETYNVHKKLNCIFPFFKSKRLCKKGIHNYIINPQHKTIPHYYYPPLTEIGLQPTRITISYQDIDLTNLKCACCGKEEILEDLKGEYYE